MHKPQYLAVTVSTMLMFLSTSLVMLLLLVSPAAVVLVAGDHAMMTKNNNHILDIKRKAPSSLLLQVNSSSSMIWKNAHKRVRAGGGSSGGFFKKNARTRRRIASSPKSRTSTRRTSDSSKEERKGESKKWNVEGDDSDHNEHDTTSDASRALSGHDDVVVTLPSSSRTTATLPAPADIFVPSSSSKKTKNRQLKPGDDDDDTTTFSTCDDYIDYIVDLFDFNKSYRNKIQCTNCSNDNEKKKKKKEDGSGVGTAEDATSVISTQDVITGGGVLASSENNDDVICSTITTTTTKDEEEDCFILDCINTPGINCQSNVLYSKVCYIDSYTFHFVNNTLIHYDMETKYTSGVYNVQTVKETVDITTSTSLSDTALQEQQQLEQICSLEFDGFSCRDCMVCPPTRRGRGGKRQQQQRRPKNSYDCTNIQPDAFTTCDVDDYDDDDGSILLNVLEFEGVIISTTDKEEVDDPTLDSACLIYHRLIHNEFQQQMSTYETTTTATTTTTTTECTNCSSDTVTCISKVVDTCMPLSCSRDDVRCIHEIGVVDHRYHHGNKDASSAIHPDDQFVGFIPDDQQVDRSNDNIVHDDNMVVEVCYEDIHQFVFTEYRLIEYALETIYTSGVYNYQTVTQSSWFDDNDNDSVGCSMSFDGKECNICTVCSTTNGDYDYDVPNGVDCTNIREGAIMECGSGSGSYDDGSEDFAVGILHQILTFDPSSSSDGGSTTTSSGVESADDWQSSAAAAYLVISTITTLSLTACLVWIASLS